MAIDVNAINAYRQAGGITNPAAGTVNSGTALNSASNQVQTPVNIAPGQVLGGEVIDVKNGEVTLRLDNNATLTASLDQNMEVSVGQKLMFQVTSNGEQTTLHPLYANLSNNNMANDALSEAGLRSTAANLAMISNMFDEGMSVNKQALQAMARVVDANPTTDPATIVQLTKLGLQVNELNIEQYENYKNFEHQIINDAEGLSTGLSDLLGTVTESAVGTGGTVTMVNNTDQTAVITADTTQAVLNENQLQLSNDILSLVSSGDKDWNAILNNPQVTGIAVQSIEVASNGPQVVVQEVPQAVPVEVEDVWAVSLNPDSEAAPEMNTSVNMGESTVNQDAG
ncbi:MAG: hypothetical protein IK111_01525, partial [Lachnospiraceae bacterium]|nr:hypothetical protein [Lachnospiraceae bacterium]